jgi:hypothetical protein
MMWCTALRIALRWIFGAVSPPHMRNTLGLQTFTTSGILVPTITSFFAITISGWCYQAAFPVVMAAIYLLLAPSMFVESPAWLLNQGRKEVTKSSLVCTARSTCRRLCRGWR